MKTTPLPSVEEEVEKYEEEAGNFSSVALIINSVRANAILTRRDNQAYTSLVEGIEGMRKDTEREPNKSDYLGRGKVEMIADIQGFGMDIAYNVALEDIIENVVKPLYGKE